MPQGFTRRRELRRVVASRECRLVRGALGVRGWCRRHQRERCHPARMGYRVEHREQRCSERDACDQVPGRRLVIAEQDGDGEQTGAVVKNRV